MTLGDRALELHPQASVRPEPFGALAYHHGNRRLVFLKDRDLTQVVMSLATEPTVSAALDLCGIAASRRPGFEAAIAALIESEMLRDRVA